MSVSTHNSYPRSRGIIAALRQAQTPTQKALEWMRLLMLALVLVGWVMYPVELFLLEHWTPAWQSKIPFLVSIPGFILTLWVFFDRQTSWVRLLFMVTMWISILTGLSGAFFHLLWNFDGEVDWDFAATMEAVAGSRPTLAALAFVHMGVTGLLCMYRAR